MGFGTSEILLLVLVSKPIFLCIALVLVTMNTGRARQQALLSGPPERDLLLGHDEC